MSAQVPKRPYYVPPPKKAIVIPVDDWTIAKALFWKRKKSQA